MSGSAVEVAFAGPLDLAVMLRQALRYEHARRGYVVSPPILIAHPRFDGFNKWERVGLRATPVMEGTHVTAIPWRPTWLASAP